MALYLHLKQGLEQRRDGNDLLLIDQGLPGLRLHDVTELQERLLLGLADSGGTFQDLMLQSSSLASFMLLQRLEEHGLIALTLQGQEGPWLSLQPLSRTFKRSYPPESPFRIQWSHYLQITPQKDGVLLEVPLQGSRVFLHHRQLTSLIMDLGHPVASEVLLSSLPTALQQESREFVMLLLTAGIAGVVDGHRRLSCDANAKAELWSKEDLMFHHRSRNGWHHEVVGASFRGLDVAPCPSLVKSDPGLKRIALPQPTTAMDESGFFAVLERRTSIREAGHTPITIDQLGRLLWASLRIKERFLSHQGTPQAYECASKPVACGGAIHEIEAYLVIHRCDGVPNGLYRYDPLNHQLLQLDLQNSAHQQLLQNARDLSGSQSIPDVLCILAARYGRVSWKYEGIAYSLILKHAGAIMQQLYLVATAIGVAPCSLGVGDSRLFAQATGLNPLRDIPVAEIMLSGAC